MSRKISVLLFDVNETLLDIEVLHPLFARIFGHGQVLREWFAQLVLYSQALTLSGQYTPFTELAMGVLRMVGALHQRAISEEDITELKTLLTTLPAHSDAAGALAQLRAAGFRLATLTNSPPSRGQSPLQRAGLSEYFEQNLSVQTVRRFKPAPETYRSAALALGVAPEEICMVAAHVWDTLGAQAFGCAGALVARPGNAPLPAEEVPQPDLVADNLHSLASKIIERWGR